MMPSGPRSLVPRGRARTHWLEPGSGNRKRTRRSRKSAVRCSRTKPLAAIRYEGCCRLALHASASGLAEQSFAPGFFGCRNQSQVLAGSAISPRAARQPEKGSRHAIDVPFICRSWLWLRSSTRGKSAATRGASNSGFIGAWPIPHLLWEVGAFPAADQQLTRAGSALP